MARLVLRSFHSVKGGVGKSTLATKSAVQFAESHHDALVLLIDMDLTGTSLADVLPLAAPYWEELREAVPLEECPSGHRSVEESREALRRRNDEPDPLLRHVAVLNDYLLYQPEDGATDADPRGLLWKLEDAPPNLAVMPSSALPRDLERILPVIFDEYQSAFLEARLESLLASVLSVDTDAETDESRDLYVVFDVPPALPGLSRAVLSAVLRLTNPEGVVDLADNGGTSPRFSNLSERDGEVFVVVSEDLQDLRAAARWLRISDDEDRIRAVVNRSTARDQEALRSDLRNWLGGHVSPGTDLLGERSSVARSDDWAPAFARAIWVGEEPTLKFFSKDGASVLNGRPFTWLEGS